MMLVRLIVILSLCCCASSESISNQVDTRYEYSELVIQGCDGDLINALYHRPQLYSHLTHLEISECADIELLPDVSFLEKLDFLAFYWNGGNGIDNTDVLLNQISSLAQLDTLILGPHNNISQLPASFSQLVRIKYVDLHLTDLHEFPSVLGECIQLEYLDLSMTNVAAFDVALGQFPSLKMLNIRDTPASRNQNFIDRIKKDLPQCEILL